jgi:hypothetical protein
MEVAELAEHALAVAAQGRYRNDVDRELGKLRIASVLL